MTKKDPYVSTPQFNKSGFISISENKTFEWQLARWPHRNIFRHRFEWTHKRDHAGVEWEIEILGLTLMLNFKDNRHWDDKLDRWEISQHDS